jgi:hypothetical protein
MAVASIKVIVTYANSVEVEEFLYREEAWEAFMAAGRRPEVKCVCFEDRPPLPSAVLAPNSSQRRRVPA